MPSQQCVICLEDLVDPPINEYLEPNHAVALVCGHIFHLECIQKHHENQARRPVKADEHFSLRYTCPSCRTTSLSRIRQTYSKEPVYVRLFFDGEAGEGPEAVTRRDAVIEAKTSPDAARAMAICKRIKQIVGLLEMADQSVGHAVLNQDPSDLNEDGLRSYLREAETQMRELEELKTRVDVEIHTDALAAALSQYASAIDLTAAANAAWSELADERDQAHRLHLEYAQREQDLLDGEAARIDLARQDAQSFMQAQHENELNELRKERAEFYEQKIQLLEARCQHLGLTLDKTLEERDYFARSLQQNEQKVTKQMEAEFRDKMVQRQEQWDALLAKEKQETRKHADTIAALTKALSERQMMARKMQIKQQSEHAEAKKRLKQLTEQYALENKEKDVALRTLKDRLAKFERGHDGSDLQGEASQRVDLAALNSPELLATGGPHDRSLEITLPGLHDPLSQPHKPSNDKHPTRRTFGFSAAPSGAFEAPDSPLRFSIGASDPPEKSRATSFFARTGPRHAQPPPASQRRAGLKPANSHVDAFGKPLPRLAHGPKRMIKP